MGKDDSPFDPSEAPDLSSLKVSTTPAPAAHRVAPDAFPALGAPLLGMAPPPVHATPAPAPARSGRLGTDALPPSLAANIQHVAPMTMPPTSSAELMAALAAHRAEVEARAPEPEPLAQLPGRVVAKVEVLAPVIRQPTPASTLSRDEGAAIPAPVAAVQAPASERPPVPSAPPPPPPSLVSVAPATEPRQSAIDTLIRPSPARPSEVATQDLPLPPKPPPALFRPEGMDDTPVPEPKQRRAKVEPLPPAVSMSDVEAWERPRRPSVLPWVLGALAVLVLVVGLGGIALTKVVGWLLSDAGATPPAAIRVEVPPQPEVDVATEPPPAPAPSPPPAAPRAAPAPPAAPSPPTATLTTTQPTPEPREEDPPEARLRPRPEAPRPEPEVIPAPADDPWGGAAPAPAPAPPSPAAPAPPGAEDDPWAE